MDDHADQVIAELVGCGFFDLEVTEEGILVYQLSDDAEAINPEAYIAMKNAMTEELLRFAESGYVETRFNDSLELEWRWTEAGIEYLKEQGQVIDPDDNLPS